MSAVLRLLVSFGVRAVFARRDLQLRLGRERDVRWWKYDEE